MIRSDWTTSMVLVGLALVQAQPAIAGICSDPEGACPDPCPAENSCSGPYGSGEDCPEGLICVPSCLPSWCFCYSGGNWTCSFDCAGECYEWPEPSGPPTHTITDLGTLGGLEAHANAINNYGDIVGQSGAPDGTRHAVLWADGEVIDLGPPDVWSSADDINNHRQVVVNHSDRAYVWDSGDIFYLGTGRATACAINDVGQVVGSGSSSACLWEGGVMTDLYDTVGLAGANGINNLGHVVGSVQAGTEWHAALWDGQGVVDLGTLGGERSSAEGINDLDQVIGESERAPGGDRRFYGFFWDGERMYDMADLVGYDSSAYAINNCGEILLPGTRRSDERFYIYSADRGLRSVRGVFGPATGWWYLLAWDMNDAGEIVGLGNISGPARAFLIAQIRGDLDGDGDVDLRDWAEFSRRFTGPKQPAIPGCERADMDRDADVDLEDFVLFQEALTVPQ